MFSICTQDAQESSLISPQNNFAINIPREVCSKLNFEAKINISGESFELYSIFSVSKNKMVWYILDHHTWIQINLHDLKSKNIKLQKVPKIFEKSLDLTLFYRTLNLEKSQAPPPKQLKEEKTVFTAFNEQKNLEKYALLEQLQKENPSFHLLNKNCKKDLEKLVSTKKVLERKISHLRSEKINAENTKSEFGSQLYKLDLINLIKNKLYKLEKVHDQAELKKIEITSAIENNQSKIIQTLKN